MYSPEKPPRDPSHLCPKPFVEDPYRAGGIVEDFHNEEDGPTMLLQASSRLGDLDRMRTAINAGATLSAKDVWGLAPLHSVAIIGSIDGVALLVESRADIDAISLRGQSALHLAVAEGKDEVLMQLLRLKADVALPTNFGSTAISIAERRRKAAAIATGERTSEVGPAELAIRAELQRRLEFAEVEEASKRTHYADAIAAREHLEAQLGTLVADLRCAKEEDDQPVEEEQEASVELSEPSLDEPTAPEEESEEKSFARSARRLRTEPAKADDKPKVTPRTGSLPPDMMEYAAKLAQEEPPPNPPSPVGSGYEYWRATKSALEEARSKGEDALKRSWLRELPSVKDVDVFAWAGELESTQCLPLPDPEDDILVTGYEWLLEVAVEEESRRNLQKKDEMLMDTGESIVQKTRDKAMVARTGATQQEWNARLHELKERDCPWNWSHVEVRQRSVSSEDTPSSLLRLRSEDTAAVFAVGDGEERAALEAMAKDILITMAVQMGVDSRDAARGTKADVIQAILGAKAELKVGDRIRALPGKSLSIAGIEYYKEHDTGKVTKAYDDDKGVPRFSITWDRTGQTSNVTKEIWHERFWFEKKALVLKVGDRIRPLPGKTLSMSGVEYYNEHDAGTVIKAYDDDKGVPRFSIFWDRTRKESNVTKETWRERFRLEEKASQQQVVFETHDVIGPLSGIVRRRSRYEELYYSGHHWTLHDPMSFQMSMNAQTADLKTEPLVIDLRAGSGQNRLRYLCDVRLDPMGLRERLGVGEQPKTRSVLPKRSRMPRPKSRPGSPEERRDKMQKSTMQDTADDAERIANATWAEVVVDGWPYVFVVATRKIRHGEEIMVDYGDDYWIAQRELFTRFLDMGQLGDETVVRVNGVERDADAYKESLSARKEHWQWQRDRLEKEWK